MRATTMLDDLRWNQAKVKVEMSGERLSGERLSGGADAQDERAGRRSRSEDAEVFNHQAMTPTKDVLMMVEVDELS